MLTDLADSAGRQRTPMESADGVGRSAVADGEGHAVGRARRSRGDGSGTQSGFADREGRTRAAVDARAASLPASHSTAAEAARAVPFSPSEWSCERVLAAVSAASIYPGEASEPTGLAPHVRLRTYQRQSVGFMLDREQSADVNQLGTTFVRPERHVRHTGIMMGI